LDSSEFWDDEEGFSEIPRSLAQVAAVPTLSFLATAQIAGQSEG
jgi:hypothetical protein